jgi:DNA-binding HxlR family transcriptional regulator
MDIESESDAAPVHVYISVIGGKWKPEILWYLKRGPMRFGELLRSVDGITQVTLTKNLRELERDGIVKRTVYPEIPPRVEYQVTTLGRTAYPLLDGISAWGRTYIRLRKKSSGGD